MATDTVGSATTAPGQSPSTRLGPLDGWIGVLRSDVAWKVVGVVACVAAFGWLVAVTGVGVIVMNASSSQRVEATKLSSEPPPVAAEPRVAELPGAALAITAPPEISAAPSMLEPASAPLAVEPPPAERAPSIASPPSVASAPQAAPRTATIAAGGLRLREQPSIQGRVLETLASGVVVSVMDGAAERDGLKWVPVRIADDRMGWVASDGLE
jgi:hypothetical protein